MAGSLIPSVQPTPNWRGLVHDLWFCLQQPTQFEIVLTGRHYLVHRRPNQFIRFAFTRDP